MASPSSGKPYYRTAVLLGVTLLLLVVFGWVFVERMETIRVLLLQAKDWLGRQPLWMFLALVILPGLPFPASVLFATAGLVWGGNPWLACGVCVVALALNQSWTYAVAAGPGRRMAGRLMERFERDLPPPRRHGVVEWILVVRLTPGVPLFVQNYYLGFLRVPFLPYLAVSLLCSGPVMVGVVLTSAGIGGGQWRYGVLGASLVIVGFALVRIFRGRAKRGGEV